MQKIRITSQTGHFGEVLGRSTRFTQDVPPPSTIIGMLRVLYGEDIDNFKFGYTFKSTVKYLDDIKVYKSSDAGFIKKGKAKDNDRDIVSDCCVIENHYDCELLIYTDIDKELQMNFAICMGKSGNPARVHFPIITMELEEVAGTGYNQFTPVSIGSGIIKPTNLITLYNGKVDSYDQQVEHLRLNTSFAYSKNYDSIEEHNIVLWQCKVGVVTYCD